MEQLLLVPQDQEIALFYSLIRQDPDFLEAIDRKQFANTPLHLAATEGRTQLALEIQRLMPSFGRKLNPNGFSPVDLALQLGHTDTVSAMIKLNPELVRVQGRQGFTPLHYAAETDDVDMLAEFLLSCPDSIEDLTVHMESAAHVAVKNGKFAAFRVLLGWLKRTDRTKALSWRDWEGNTVLHLAASTNQPKVLKLLIKEVRVNDKNSKGLTALDIVMELPTQVNGKALKILHRSRAKRGAHIRDAEVATFADYLSSKITIKERTIKLGAFLQTGVPHEMVNATLVVAVLIATATYQAALTPPGGFSSQSRDNTTDIPSNNGTVYKLKTQEENDGANVVSGFLLLNSIAFAASVGTIVSVFPIRKHNVLVHLSLLCLLISFLVLLQQHQGKAVSKGTFIIVVCYILSDLIRMWKIQFISEYNVWFSRRLMGSNNFFNIDAVRTLVYQGKYSLHNFNG